MFNMVVLVTPVLCRSPEVKSSSFSMALHLVYSFSSGQNEWNAGVKCYQIICALPWLMVQGSAESGHCSLRFKCRTVSFAQDCLQSVVLPFHSTHKRLCCHLFWKKQGQGIRILIGPIFLIMPRSCWYVQKHLIRCDQASKLSLPLSMLQYLTLILKTKS